MADSRLHRRFRRARIVLAVHRWRIVLTGLRIVAEAGWITVIYAAAAVLVSHRAPILGPIEMIGFVAAGFAVGLLARPRREVGPALLIIAVITGGVLGWLASAEARSLADPAKALGIHFAGWVAALAVLRGALITTADQAAIPIERLMRNVPPAIALIWAYVTFAAPPELWLPFAVGAMWGTVTFLSSSIVGIGMARLTVLHRHVRDARARRAWRWLVIAIGVGVIPVAIPIGVLAGIPLSAMLAPIVGPIQWLLGLLRFPLIFVIWILSEALRPVAGPLGQFLDELQLRMDRRVPIERPEDTTIGEIIGILMLAVTVVIVLEAIFLFARWLLSRREKELLSPDDVVPEFERQIVVPAVRAAPRARPRLPRFRRRPRDVVTAYLDALRELETKPDYARDGPETPAAHAARVSDAGMPAATELSRLAAGYQLARYGERTITRAENRRAVSRVDRLRHAFRSYGGGL